MLNRSKQGSADPSPRLKAGESSARSVESLKYQIIISWSDRDEAFVAKVPELPGCMAHGATYEDALTNIEEAMIF